MKCWEGTRLKPTIHISAKNDSVTEPEPKDFGSDMFEWPLQSR